ncbi:MAG: polysaccharide pyruvyl transferase family protein [Burkholderiales bacterium]|jgi:succinoglycan biosynthesis protein ExoV|nr:polysaccharide pyruvyl transferase family protein [Burkholderiales bacterium]
MELFVYRGASPNFGDELNHWLWPRLLGDAFDGAGDLFLGIGSTILSGLSPRRRKVVFGAGYGGYTAMPALDASWDVYFVRGKLSSRALGLGDDKAIGDAGILIRSLGIQRQATPGRVSFMPHWESVWPGRWAQACRLADVQFIDPTASVDTVLAAIAGTELLLTEAMHGAIIADVLRTPWVATSPAMPHRMKWDDWASALDLHINWAQLPRSSLLEQALRLAPRGGVLANALSARRRATAVLRDYTPDWWVERAAQQLRKLADSAVPSLSRDTDLDTAHSRMSCQLDWFVRREGLGRIRV